MTRPLHTASSGAEGRRTASQDAVHLQLPVRILGVAPKIFTRTQKCHCEVDAYDILPVLECFREWKVEQRLRARQLVVSHVVRRTGTWQQTLPPVMFVNSQKKRRSLPCGVPMG